MFALNKTGGGTEQPVMVGISTEQSYFLNWPRFPGFFTSTQKRVDDAAEIAAFLLYLLPIDFFLHIEI